MLVSLVLSVHFHRAALCDTFHLDSLAYYNDNDAYACKWLRNLIIEGHLPFGVVDSRPIQEVTAKDLAGFTQCHFFAGIGGWALALKMAGWPEDRPVWTGSCPCQPFSVAGKGKGEEDERHLWPQFRRLIEECGAATVFGEQVASKAGRGWLSRVRVDLEALGYGVGAADISAAGAGAPHIRQRLWWVADNVSAGLEKRQGESGHIRQERAAVERSGDASGVGNTQYTVRGTECEVNGDPHQRNGSRRDGVIGRAVGESWSCGVVLAQSEQEGVSRRARESRSAGSGMEDTHVPSSGRNASSRQQPLYDIGEGRSGRVAIANGVQREGEWGFEVRGWHTKNGIDKPGPWDDYYLIPCFDGKLRRVESGLLPLAHGVPARMGRLRGYGNAIVPPVAAEFIRAYLDCRP